MRPAARLWEALLSALAMALATAVAASCFSAASGLSREAYVQDLGLGRVQSAADVLSATGGDLDAVAGFFGAGSADGGMLDVPFDGEMEPCSTGGAYVLSCGPVAADGGMGTCPVSLRSAGGHEVFSVTASWQEGGGWDA